MEKVVKGTFVDCALFHCMMCRFNCIPDHIRQLHKRISVYNNNQNEKEEKKSFGI